MIYLIIFGINLYARKHSYGAIFISTVFIRDCGFKYDFLQYKNIKLHIQKKRGRKMKKGIVKILTVIMTVGLLGGCSTSSNEKNVSTASIVESIHNEIELRKTEAVDEAVTSEMYYLGDDIVEESTIERGVINTGIELIAVVKAKEGKVEDAKMALEKVKDDKKQSAFYPGESEAVDSAEVKVVDNYVGLFIIPDYDESGENNSEKAAEIFEKALN